MATRAIFLIALIALAFTGIVRADGAQKLPGSAVKIEDAVSKADAVFAGEITETGSEVLLPPTMPYCGDLYRGIKVTVLQVYSQKKLRLLPLQQLNPLRGPVGDQTLVALFVETILGETRHKVGSSYLFFATRNHGGNTEWPNTASPYNHLEKDDGFYIALKLLPATDDNIAMMKKLIAR